MGTEYGKQLVAAGKPSRRHYAPVPRKSDFPVPKPKMRVKKKDKLLKELTAIGNSAVGETGKKANTRLRSMAKKAGLVVKEGGEHQRIERPDGSLVTPLPHSPKGDGTIKSIVKSILDEVDG